MNLSPRLAQIVEALPVQPGSRVLEVGCGPGAAARAVAATLTSGRVLAIDRSQRAVHQATQTGAALVTSGVLEFRCVAVEEFELQPDEKPYDTVFAVRVGALDGRHPEAGRLALRRLRAATTPQARLFVDSGTHSVLLADT